MNKKILALIVVAVLNQSLKKLKRTLLIEGIKLKSMILFLGEISPMK